MLPKKSIPALNLEQARVVGENLDFLFRAWNQDIDDASLRITSTVLHLLVIEDAIGNVARSLDLDLRILVPDVRHSIHVEDLQSYRFWQAGGAKYKGMQVKLLSIRNRVLSDAELKKSFLAGKDNKSYLVKMQAFLSEPSFIVDGILINRAEVIKYVANKLGGKHFDESRVSKSEREQSLNEKFVLMDKIRASQIFSAEKDAIYYELSSIGQRLVNSRDVRSLRKRLQGYISSPSIIRQ